MDLNIELTKLYALHMATICFDHAIRETGKTEWSDFTPSRFIYAYFTFNSIYSFDWAKSFKENKAIKWTVDEKSGRPPEDMQFKKYLREVDRVLSPNAAKAFGKMLSQKLADYGVERPVEDLEAVSLINATKEIKELAQKLPGTFRKLVTGKSKPEDFFAETCVVLKFVYGVRCNLFHGSKSRIQLLDTDQQRRLLIYSATLIATNSLLFEAAAAANVGWHPVDADYQWHESTVSGD